MQQKVGGRIKELPHPYGVKPPGNFFFETDASIRSTRSRGLGSLDILTDDLMIELLSFVNPNELCRVIQCSRAAYCYGHHSDLWRDNVLRKSGGLSIKFMSTWKDTFFHMFCSNSNSNSSSSSDSSCSINSSTASSSYSSNSGSSSSYKDHVPIRINGIYSDLLHRSWLSHTFDLERHCPGILKHSDIQRIDADDLSIEAFLERFEVKNIPLIITNGVKDWKAMTKWNRNYLIASCGEQLFRATSATAPLSADFTLEQYFQYASQTHEEVPLYLFERNFSQNAVLQGDYDVPKYFNSNCYPGTDLFRFYGEARRPDHKWLIAGPKRSGSIFHIDPNQTNAWNVCIEGRKKWIFYPKEVSPPGVMSSSDGADVTVPISTGEWLLAFWSFHLEARKHPDPAMRPLECTLLPGEIIFVPHGYWHMVVNLDDCIALTHNYVSTSNLSDCLRFLRDKQDQISGVRDRPGTVPPEAMFNEIVANLSSILSAEEILKYVGDSEKPEQLLLVDQTETPSSLNETRRHKNIRKKTDSKRKWGVIEDRNADNSKTSSTIVDDSSNSNSKSSNSDGSSGGSSCKLAREDSSIDHEYTQEKKDAILATAAPASISSFCFGFSNF